jgi:hypothetical protein
MSGSGVSYSGRLIYRLLEITPTCVLVVFLETSTALGSCLSLPGRVLFHKVSYLGTLRGF